MGLMGFGSWSDPMEVSNFSELRGWDQWRFSILFRSLRFVLNVTKRAGLKLTPFCTKQTLFKSKQAAKQLKQSGKISMAKFKHSNFSIIFKCG